MEVPAKGNVLERIIPTRYMLAVLGSVGMGIVYGLKVNLSVAMVGMLNHTAIGGMKTQQTGNAATDHTEECAASSEVFVVEDGPFIWSEPMQGMILSCYFWGYIVSQMPAARIAEVFSAKWVMFFSVFINVVCTLLTPVMAVWHPIAVILMRIGEGIGGGVTFPAMHVLLSKWAPPSERSVMSALVYAGTSLGTVLSMLMAGGLTSTLGWESVFYVMGSLSAIWCVLWVFLIQDTPLKQPLISVEERELIVSSLGTGAGSGTKKRQKVPWKSVFTSPAFLAILVAHTFSNWGWYTVLIELPFYMKQVLKFNMKKVVLLTGVLGSSFGTFMVLLADENAILTALPFFTLWVFSIGLSRILDALRVRGKITTTTARKIATFFASVVPAACLLALCYVNCNRELAVVLMTIAITCIGGMFCGFLSNHIDIAPNYAGTLVAITNTVATIPGIIVPVFVGHLTQHDQSIRSWRVIFFTTIAFFMIEIVVYTIFGSGEEQSWNKQTKDNDGDTVEGQPLQQKGNKEKGAQ